MLKIGVLASHEGTTLQCIHDACASGRIRGRVVVVISNNGGSGAVTRARAAGIPAHHLSSVTHPTPDSLDAAIRAALTEAEADLVFLAGYLKRLGPATLAAFRGRVLNTHPALLPKFGGQGMFGDRVFEAVLESGESESGASVHLVDNDYDAGPVILEGRVPVEPKDCVESLKARVRDCEREVVVQALAAIASGELRLDSQANLALQPMAAGASPVAIRAILFDLGNTLVGYYTPNEFPMCFADVWTSVPRCWAGTGPLLWTAIYSSVPWFSITSDQTMPFIRSVRAFGHYLVCTRRSMGHQPKCSRLRFSGQSLPLLG